MFLNNDKFKLNSITYNNFIKKKQTLEFSISKQIVLILSLLVMFYYMFSEDEIFNLTKTICAPETLTNPTTAELRKLFAKNAETNPDNVFPSRCWNVSSDNNSLTLNISREAFLALQGHHIKLKTPLENSFIDFSKVPTRHTKNPRDILKVTSPYYKPEIRHYKDLMSLGALTSEAKFLLSVELDPHIHKSKQYMDTHRRFCNKHELQTYEIKYLKYLSKKLKHTTSEENQIKAKYCAAKFYGKLLDFTNFSEDSEKTNAN